MGKTGKIAGLALVAIVAAVLFETHNSNQKPAEPLHWNADGVLDQRSTRIAGKYVAAAGHECEALAAFHLNLSAGSSFVVKCRDGAQFLVVDKPDGRAVASCAAYDPAGGRCL